MTPPLDVRDGYLYLCDRPGLGVELDLDYIEAHPDPTGDRGRQARIAGFQSRQRTRVCGMVARIMKTFQTPPDATLIDPDPFAIGFALLGVLLSGGAYLEARRLRLLSQQQREGELRSAWFRARRTLIHARRIVEEFATYVAEDGYGDQDFLFGTARMNLPRDRVDQLRRLHGNAQTTASHMADDLDDLSDFLGESYQQLIDEILSKLHEQQLPHSYDAVVILARDSVTLCERLIERVGREEGFLQGGSSER